MFLAATIGTKTINNSWGVVMHVRKYLSIFLIGLVFAIAGCSSDSTSGISEEDKLPDTDNDGIVDKNDPDIDGDNILNKDDTDDDGDGTPDATDPTPNGPGGEAPTPDLTCTSAKISPPKDATTGRLTTVSWKLLPEGCEASATVNRTVVVTASSEGETTESQSASVGKLTTNIILPHACGWSGTQTITYDFSEIGNALGDTSGNYTAEREATVGNVVGAACNCTSAVIDWPTAGVSPGAGSAVSWELFPLRCSITDAMKSALPTGTSYTTTTTGDAHNVNPNKPTQRYSNIVIPCAPNAPEGTTEKRAIAWDFSALATALGDSNVGAYKTTVTQAAAANGCAGDD